MPTCAHTEVLKERDSHKGRSCLLLSASFYFWSASLADSYARPFVIVPVPVRLSCSSAGNAPFPALLYAKGAYQQQHQIITAMGAGVDTRTHKHAISTAQQPRSSYGILMSRKHPPKHKAEGTG